MTKIVFIDLSTKIKYKLLTFFFIATCFSESYSQNNSKKDSVKVNAKEILKQNNSSKTDTLKKKNKSAIDAIVNRKAKKYEKLDQKSKKLTLYDEAELKYKEFELKSGIIVLDYEKNEVFAGRIKDSTGKLTQRPYFKQGENVVEPDSIRYNIKSGKTVVWNSYTEQGEIKLLAEKSKRENDSMVFSTGARFTTSLNRDDPEYYFYSRKVKLVPGKKLVTGLTNMYIADIPTPIGIPFAFFPMTTKSQSGVIIPTPGQANERGYFLQNGGYYFAINDHLDLAILGDYYTNGSYAVRFENNYNWRYKYSGNLSFRYENNVNGERGFPNYGVGKNYLFQWSHSQDPKSSPKGRLSASVNFGSTQYYRNSINLANIGATVNNNMASSINYSTNFSGFVPSNLAVTISSNLNTNTKTVSLVLPSLNYSMDRIFPFGNKDGGNKGIFQNINLQYSARASNDITTTEDKLFTNQIFEDSKTGVIHQIPLSTNFKIFKYFSVNTNISFTENWVFHTTRKDYWEFGARDVVERVNGFDSFRTYNGGASLGTTVYGTYTFKEGSKLKALRHTLTPSIGYGFSPSFEQYYDTYINKDGKAIQYSRFENTFASPPGLNKSSALNFALANAFEAKVTDEENKKEGFKKVKILNQLNFASSYNFEATEFKLGNITMNTGASLIKNRVNLNLNANFDPYAVSNEGIRINEFSIANGGSLIRLTNATINLDFDLNSKDFSDEKADEIKKKKNEKGEQNGGRSDDLFGKPNEINDNRESLYEEGNQNSQTELYKFIIPWDFKVNYSMTLSNNRGVSEITNQSLQFSANVDLAVRWKVGVSSGYDFAQKGITFTNLRFERDLESWRMSFNWSPIGIYSSWSFFIGIKSSMLSDIKWEKNRLPEPRLR